MERHLKTYLSFGSAVRAFLYALRLLYTISYSYNIKEMPITNTYFCSQVRIAFS